MSVSPSEGTTRSTNPDDGRVVDASEIGKFDLTMNLSHLLRRAHFQAEAIFDEHLRQFNTTPRQKALLIASFQNPGATINDLSDGIALDRNSTKEMLNRLVERGLLLKQHSKTDRRAWEVDITDAGIDLLCRILPGDQDVERTILGRLPEEHHLIFRKCLRILGGAE